MDVTVSKKDLSQAVAASMEFVSTSTTSPLLKNLFFETRGKDILITATDSERSSRYRVEASEIHQPGSLVVPAAGARDFLNTAPGNTVRLEDAEGKVVARSGRSRITFRLPGGDCRLPDTPLSGGETEEIFRTGAEDLAGLFSRTSFINRQGAKVSSEEGSVNLSGSFGVRLVASQALSAYAFETIRVSRVRSSSKPAVQCEMTIPPRAASWLSSVRWGKEDTVTALRHKAGIIFCGGDLSVFFRTTNFPLPDMSSQFSPDYKHRAVFNTDSFRHSIEAVSRFSETEGAQHKYRRVSITLREGEAVIQASTGIGDVEAEDVVWASHDAPPDTKIYFNPAVLLDFCRAQASEKFSMKFNAPSGIMRFGHKGDDDFVYLAVAMR